jgi:hypothetical protein
LADNDCGRGKLPTWVVRMRRCRSSVRDMMLPACFQLLVQSFN